LPAPACGRRPSLLRELYEKLAANDRAVRFVAVHEEIRERLGLDVSIFHSNTDRALEYAEDALLE